MTHHDAAPVPVGNEARLRFVAAPPLVDETGSRDQNGEFPSPTQSTGISYGDNFEQPGNCSFPLTPIERRATNQLGLSTEPDLAMHITTGGAQ